MNSHKVVIGVLVTLLMVMSVGQTQTQPAILVKDINPGPGRSMGISGPSPFLDFNGTVFFPATDGSAGRELWKSDGAVSGTILVKDINHGGGHSVPDFITKVNSTLFFRADDGIVGLELWKSDGTTQGTMLVKDIYPGPNSSIPISLTNINGILFFAADDGTNGKELWKSDGTAIGTVMVKDINPGISGSTPTWLAELDGTFLFSADDGTNGRELWISDGTTSGTLLLKDIVPGASSSEPGELINFNSIILFYAGSGALTLWKSDGTATGTVQVKSVTHFNLPSYAIVNGTYFFAGNDGIVGLELWKSDGTTAGTVLIKDINPGGASSKPGFLTDLNGTLFFSADDGPGTSRLWKSDGTTNGTVKVSSLPAIPADLVNVNGTLFFEGSDIPTGRELWKSDGTNSGTVLVKDIKPGPHDSEPKWLTNISGTLFFTPEEGDGIAGAELWAVKSPIPVTLTPINPPIQIPPDGGSFSFDATLTNISGRSETRDVWNVITAPNGATFTTIGPATLTLPSGFSGMKTLSQQIPGGAPAGQYTYAFNIGAYPDTIESMDSFTFTKSVSPVALQKSDPIATGDWSVIDVQTGQPVDLADWSAVPIETAEPIPQEFVLRQNYPNPFNPSTTIRYQLPTAEKVRIVIYDLLGRQVRELVNTAQAAGVYSVQWDGRNQAGLTVAAGLYIYKIQAGQFTQNRKMLFLK